MVKPYIFIHINKTGGTSIRSALRIPPYNRTLKTNTVHKCASEFIKAIGRSQWDDLFSFAVIRNPWDRVVSHYEYRRRKNIIKNKKMTFDKWVELTYAKKHFKRKKMFWPQYDWLLDKDGKLAVTQVLHFESLSTDFQKLCTNLNLDPIPSLPHLNKTPRDEASYQSYYSKKSRKVIADWFRRDIREFDYTF